MEVTKTVWPAGLIFGLVAVAGLLIALWRMKRERKNIGTWGWSITIAVLIVVAGLIMSVDLKMPYIGSSCILLAVVFAFVVWIYSVWLAEGVEKKIILARFCTGFLMLLVVTSSTVGVGTLFYFVAENNTPLVVGLFGGIVWFFAVVFLGLFFLDVLSRDSEEKELDEDVTDIDEVRRKKEQD
jgi:hypothetical protein